MPTGFHTNAVIDVGKISLHRRKWKMHFVSVLFVQVDSVEYVFLLIQVMVDMSTYLGLISPTQAAENTSVIFSPF